jgi:hypothetical protein
MKKFAVRNKHGEIVSQHKTLGLANSKLRKIDSVSHSLYADDVDWLTDQEEALQGYNHSVSPLGRGGKREGAGAPTKPANLKKKMVSVKLPKWLVEWTAEQPESRAVLIEDALKKVHKLKIPPAD